MVRKIKRTKDYELTLEILNDDFICPPRQSQRNWLLNKAVGEFVQDLSAMDKYARKFVSGVNKLTTEDRTHAELTEQEIMEDWQIPIMREMARLVTESHGNVLEIGFGRGVASTMIQDFGPKSHTIIECNDTIVGNFENWRKDFPDSKITLVHGLWQDTLPTLGDYDAIFFHTYPLNEADFVEQIGESTTFAEHFFSHASDHLRPGGVFSYLSNEIDSLSRTHQRLLFEHYSGISISLLDDLAVPENVADAWWAPSMVVVKATK